MSVVNKCLDCGGPVSIRAKRCRPCHIQRCHTAESKLIIAQATRRTWLTHPKYPRLPYQNRDFLLKKYVDEKMSAQQIADLFGRSCGAVKLWLWKHNIPIRHNTDIAADELYKNRDWLANKYLTEGLSTSQIGQICGRDHKTILPWLRKLGIKIRRPSQAMTGKKFSPDHCRKISVATKFRLAHSAPLSPERVMAMYAAQQRRPNGPEKILGNLIPGKIQYVGDGSWWTSFRDGRHKNPDFLVPGQRKVVEVFGDYWHRNDDPQVLIDLYKQIGFDCLVVWERELHKQPALVQERVDQFLSN